VTLLNPKRPSEQDIGVFLEGSFFRISISKMKYMAVRVKMIKRSQI